MSWVKLDDGFPDHPKVLSAGPEGVCLWVCGLAYCNRQPKRDGFIPAPKVCVLYPMKQPERAAEKLVACGLWDRVDGGYQVHDYHDFQPSAAVSDDLRAARAEAGRRGGQRSGETRRKEATTKQVASTREATDERSNEANANPVPVPVPEPGKQERTPAPILPVELRGINGIRQPIPPLIVDDPDNGIDLLPSLVVHARKLGCTNPKVQWAHWHAKRWAKRDDPKTWQNNWYADFEAWCVNHERFGCPCQRRPSPADNERDANGRVRELRSAGRRPGEQCGPIALGSLIDRIPGATPEERQEHVDEEGRQRIAAQAAELRRTLGGAR